MPWPASLEELQASSGGTGRYTHVVGGSIPPVTARVVSKKKREETRGEETRRDETRREETRREGKGRDETRREGKGRD
jgi:hypothetical protein